MTFINRGLLGLGALGILLSAPRVARAGGYDTPMLYSALHMGMGGSAIGYVKDPSALFHNPAGLGHVERAEVIGDFSLLLGGIHASPGAAPAGRDVDSETTVAPFFLLGGAYRLHPMLTLASAYFRSPPPGPPTNTGLETRERKNIKIKKNKNKIKTIKIRSKKKIVKRYNKK